MKTKGSKDIVKRRHRRSDIGKKREYYAGRKTKPRRKIHGRFIPYVSKRKRGDNIHVGFYRVTPMTQQGFMNFPGEIRRKMHRFTYGTKVHFVLDPGEINTSEKIADFACNNLWDGEWQLRLPTTSKNYGHCSYRAFAVLKIRDSPEGLRCRVNPSFKRRSLKRLWWFFG
jgi:hypothetical protein